MEIIYYKDSIGNFGDDLNSWIWQELIPNIHEIQSNEKILGIGSIINTQIIEDNNVIVLGSGVGYGYLPKTKDLSISFVRGKLTAKTLNIDDSLATSDSAILLNCIDQFKPIPENKRNGVIFIPHHETIKNYDLNIIKKTGIEIINPSSDSKYVINTIRKSKLVIAEAMHAAIVADTMRVRWIPVVCSRNINTFKWLDWLSMFNIDYNPIYLGLPDLKKEKINKLNIKYNLCLYKPSYKNMEISDLLIKQKLSFLKKKLYKIKLSLLKRMRISHTAQTEHECDFIYKLTSIINNKSYLSNDEIFYKNLNKAKIKLNEFMNKYS